MHRAWLSLGSNLDPKCHLRSAVAELRKCFGAVTVSPVYRFAAVGFDGPDFLNLAVGLNTQLDPVALNSWLHALEDRHGRRRDMPRYSSRTLDIDIVLFDDAVLEGPDHLDIPRKELDEAYVARPLADIAPLLRHPVTGTPMTELAEMVCDGKPCDVVEGVL